MLSALKLLGIFVSLVSGMVATAFETKKDDGKGSKRLSLFGQIVFGCVVLGSLITAITQRIEDQQKKIEDQQKKETDAQDVKRIAYIINGTQRITYRIEPITWNVTVRYKIDPDSGLFDYVQRIRSSDKGLAGWDIVGEYIPDRTDPKESKAWTLLMKPSVYVGILKPQIYLGAAQKLPFPIIHGISVEFDSNQHADPEGNWKPGPNASSPPFYSRMSLQEKGDDLWLIQNFVVRNSPEATSVSGAISPLDLIGDYVVAELGIKNAYVDEVSMLFPSANQAIPIRLKQTGTIMDFNRSVGMLDEAVVRTALDIPAAP